MSAAGRCFRNRVVTQLVEFPFYGGPNNLMDITFTAKDTWRWETRSAARVMFTWQKLLSQSAVLRGMKHAKPVTLSGRKLATKNPCSKTFSGNVVRHLLAYKVCTHGWWEPPLLPEILGQIDPPTFKNGDFQSIFACCASAVTPAKTVQLSLIGRLLRAFQWARWPSIRCTLPPSLCALGHSVIARLLDVVLWHNHLL